MMTVKSTCCYCGTGCGVEIDVDHGQVLAVRGDPEHPANFGRLCTKGLTLAHTLHADSRLAEPRLRPGRLGSGQAVSWDVALDTVSERLAAIIAEHGPESVAFYLSGQMLTEDYYVYNKLARGLIGTPHVDTNSRLCMSSAVTGYKLALGADAPPCSYEDFDHADCVLIAGSNMAYAHPVLFRRLEAARAANPKMKLIVVDPRRTDTAASADLHLAIQPGTDVALFNGMLHALIWTTGWTATLSTRTPKALPSCATPCANTPQKWRLIFAASAKKPCSPPPAGLARPARRCRCGAWA